MPYKDPEKRREAATKYREKNRDKLNAAERQRRKDDPEWAEKQRAKVRKYYKDRPEYRREQKRKFAKNNPESVVATKRKGRLGISRADQEALFASQNAQCAICDKEITFVKSHLDHCHTTGKVRGFLCQWCNYILGNAKDDLKILQRAIEYLEGDGESSFENTLPPGQPL